MHISQTLMDGWGRDPAAERDLLELIHGAVAPAIRSAAARWHASSDVVEDVEQEFWVWLLEHNLQPLRGFREHSAGQFQAFLWVVATRRAHRWFRRQSRERYREKRAVRGRVAESSGPTEAEVRAILAELELRLTADQRQYLEELLGDQAAAPTPVMDAGAAHPPSRKSLSRKVLYNLWRKVLWGLRRR